MLSTHGSRHGTAYKNNFHESLGWSTRLWKRNTDGNSLTNEAPTESPYFQ